MTTTDNGTHTGAETGTRTRKARAARAAQMIDELTEQRVTLPRLAPGTPACERRDREVHRALITARLAGWWRVLARTTAWGEVPEVFVTAAYFAYYAELNRAREDLEHARFWAERAAKNGTTPAPDVTGAGS